MLQLIFYDCGQRFNHVLYFALFHLLTWIGSKVKIFRSRIVLVVVNVKKNWQSCDNKFLQDCIYKNRVRWANYPVQLLISYGVYVSQIMIIGCE